jgi:hypothetical protein
VLEKLWVEHSPRCRSPMQAGHPREYAGRADPRAQTVARRKLFWQIQMHQVKSWLAARRRYLRGPRVELALALEPLEACACGNRRSQDHYHPAAREPQKLDRRVDCGRFAWDLEAAHSLVGRAARCGTSSEDMVC